MKIIIHLVHALHGGVANVAYNLIRYQCNQNNKVVLVYSDSSITSIDSFISQLNCSIDTIKVKANKFPGAYMLFGLQINKVYKKYRMKYPETDIIVHAHNVQTIGLLSRLKYISLVCTIHGISNSVNKSIRKKISNLIYRLILNKLSYLDKSIIAVSKSTAEYYNKYLSSGKIKYILNGTIISKMNKKCENKNFIIGHVGDISYQKGWYTTFQGYLKIPKIYHESIKFHFAGRPIDFSEEQIEKLIIDNSLCSSLRYNGIVPNARDNFIPKIDVLILASKSEGLPMVLIEAMSYGIPVLATDVGGICEILIDGYNGFVIRDSNDICKRILELYNDTTLYNKISKNALDTYKNKFTAEIMYQNYEVEYSKLI